MKRIHDSEIFKKKKLKGFSSNESIQLKALEFFSGIGGLNYGLINSGAPAKVVQSFDMNELANAVYFNNFQEKPNNRSNTRKILVETLSKLGYIIQEFIVSPLQIGIPNDRLRYYLIAKKSLEIPIGADPEYQNKPLDSIICTKFPNTTPNFLKSIYENLDLKPLSAPVVTQQAISSFLQDDINPSTSSDFAVPSSFIEKRKNYNFDVVIPESTKCSTFTKVSS
ncbi:DNA (cytosine-5)-methyltransferase [Smittium mucronatum]|uniref:DNA (Cytosine-5)-methyltransferase n=1 Tax=Smittium mucronatum TaxID=133383 RepID=A0A1R0GTJ0_9FUNG|nr:DNA (cytosine-5)-methyltransferase [Smittium mucronatum]